MNDDRMTSSGISRRRFLGRLGAGAVAVGAGSTLRVKSGRAASAASVRHQSSTGVPAGFGRIFDRLEPFADAKRRGLEQALVELGSPGGLLDARDELERGPVSLDHGPVALCAQSRQPDAHGRHDVHGPVHGPRHDVRPRVAARQADSRRRARRTGARRRSISTRCTARGRSPVRSFTTQQTARS